MFIFSMYTNCLCSTKNMKYLCVVLSLILYKWSSVSSLFLGLKNLGGQHDVHNKIKPRVCIHNFDCCKNNIYKKKRRKDNLKMDLVRTTLPALIQIVKYSPYTSRTSWAWTQCPGLRLGRGRGRGAARTSPTSTTPRSTGAGAKHKGGYDVHAAYIEKDYHV